MLQQLLDCLNGVNYFLPKILERRYLKLYHMTALKNMNSTEIKNSIPIESVPTLILFQAL